ncbi:helix-turn-helix domain-containing protein [Romboutsia weinsteinii]|uniref:Helix-turn-helix domain-containing protein n=1 Tax=Romboutsia weinsteinii TaxID=2020949 RepID=A0A371JAH1_9FIRM|nr:helix-turn-helix domain-containing protein [Romboutsia weinsteinii]RDY29769.1 helix-turn-helix domain-containing protein [Romboutsia weinsteinii]
MSYTVIDNEIFEDKNLKHTEFRVLAYLIRNYNASMGYSFPTREQIITSCKMNKDTVGSVLKSLEEKGYITRKNNPSKSGRNTIYLIHKYLVVEESSPAKPVKTTEEPTVEKVHKDEQETEELIKKFYAGEIEIQEQTEQEELKEKIDVFQAHLSREVSHNLIVIIKDLDWDEIVNADMQINTNKKEDYCTEKYIINAIYDNKKTPKLKLVK